MKVVKIGTMSQKEIRERTLAIARGEYKPKPDEPKIWFTSIRSQENNMRDIKHIIGDYQTFFSDLLYRMTQVGINISGMPLSHLLYRTTTIPEYEKLRDELKSHCSEFVETQFNGRAVAILILKEALKLEGGFTVSMIELPAPRSVHMYPSGLESIGVVLGKQLPDFINQHKAVLTGIKEHGIYCQPAFITFDNEKTAKFYDISLREIVILQGWKIEDISSNFTTSANHSPMLE